MTLEQLQGTWDQLLAWLLQPAPLTRAPWAAVLGLGLGAAVAVAMGVWWGSPAFRRWWTDETP
ncbi:MAG TPA: hypothetical protein VHS99_06315, partial [Chloroflexota bacterium]|nr:hypothetical protein [Chloroflexota bacterium]